MRYLLKANRNAAVLSSNVVEKILDNLRLRAEFHFMIPRVQKVPVFACPPRAIVTEASHFTIPRVQKVPLLPSQTVQIVMCTIPLYDSAGVASPTPINENSSNRKVGKVF